MRVAMMTVLRLDMLEQYKLAKEYGIEIDVLTSGSEPSGMASRKYINQCNLGEVIVSTGMILEVCKNYDVITSYEFYGVVQKMIMEKFDNFIPEVAWNVPTYGTHFNQPAIECLDLAKTKVKSFIAKSQSVHDCLVQEGIDEDKIHLINAPCDTDRFKPMEKPERLQDKLVFLFIGRVQEQKGIFEIFHAFHRANIPSSKLIMIGPKHPTNTWDFNELDKWIEMTNSDVEIHGYIEPEDIHQYYNWGDVFVTLPNTDRKFVEQIGLTVVQALASGLPVITNDFGGQIDYIDETCGYLIPHKNYAKAAEAMRDLASRGKRIKMSWEARNKAVSQFNLDDYSKKIKEVYENVI